MAKSCNCSLRTKLVGDGCSVCNPAKALEYATENLERMQSAIDGFCEWVRSPVGMPPFKALADLSTVDIPVEIQFNIGRIVAAIKKAEEQDAAVVAQIRARFEEANPDLVSGCRYDPDGTYVTCDEYGELVDWNVTNKWNRFRDAELAA